MRREGPVNYKQPAILAQAGDVQNPVSADDFQRRGLTGSYGLAGGRIDIGDFQGAGLGRRTDVYRAGRARLGFRL